MTLYFINSLNMKRTVKENIEQREIISEISDYVKKSNPNFKIHYYRSWETKEGIMYDVGSHSEFFLATTN